MGEDDPRTSMASFRYEPLEGAPALSNKIRSVDQRMRLGMRCRLSPTADVPSDPPALAMYGVAVAPGSTPRREPTVLIVTGNLLL